MIIGGLIYIIFGILVWLAGFLPNVGINDVALADGIVNAFNTIAGFFSWAGFWFPVNELFYMLGLIIEVEIIGYFIYVGLVFIRLVRGGG
jgi:hypothetical protein